MEKRGELKSSRGISPVIATVLLIGMVVVVALIIFIWFRGIIGESAVKSGKDIKLVCDDVQFEADYSDGDLNVVNLGTVPIFELRVKMEGGGSHTTEEITHNDYGDEGWELGGLLEGGTFSGELDNVPINAEKITVFPILIGKTSKGERKTYVCEGQYGEEISLS